MLPLQRRDCHWALAQDCLRLHPRVLPASLKLPANRSTLIDSTFHGVGLQPQQDGRNHASGSNRVSLTELPVSIFGFHTTVAKNAVRSINKHMTVGTIKHPLLK